MNAAHTDPHSEDNKHHSEYNKKRDQQSQDPAPIVQIGDMTCIKQTNSSPMDPRNWSRFRKEAAFAVIVFGSCACGAIGPLLVPGFTTVAADLGVSLTQVTLLNGSLVMALGVSAYIANALATAYGTRLIFLVTTIALAATCCWGAAAMSYGSLLAARVFQGLGMGGWYALAGTTSITQMFDVHERGLRVGIWNFAVLVSVNIAPVISGKVIVSLTWRWSFWLLAITFGVLLVFTIFYFPETSSKGAAAFYEQPDTQCEEGQVFTYSTESKAREAEAPFSESMKTGKQAELYHVSFWKRFFALDAVSSGDPSQALEALVAPLRLLSHPVAIWGCLMWSVTFTWVIIQGAVADQVWEAPPYNLSPSAVGNLVGIAPLIGSALGCLMGGAACDWLSRVMAKRNNNVYEPESRLLIIAPALLTCVAGGFGLGESIQRGMAAILTAVFLAILNFGVGVGCTGIVAYTNDTFQERAGEAFGLAMLTKSAFAFGISFKLNDYYAAQGPRVFFSTWGGLTIGVMLLTIPMYIWGKRTRGRWEVNSAPPAM